MTFNFSMFMRTSMKRTTHRHWRVSVTQYFSCVWWKHAREGDIQRYRDWSRASIPTVMWSPRRTNCMSLRCFPLGVFVERSTLHSPEHYRLPHRLYFSFSQSSLKPVLATCRSRGRFRTMYRISPTDNCPNDLFSDALHSALNFSQKSNIYKCGDA